jgi:hypothetical protein
LAGPSTREDRPRGNTPADTSDDSALVPAIVFLLVLGLALRFIIAYVLLPGSGFPNDLSSFQGWSNQLVANTPLGFYDKAGFLDYPPVYLLFLWVLGLVLSPLGGLGDAVKLIPIFTDLALAYIVFAMARDMGAPRGRALVAMIVILVNPITWINSAIWGQADTVGSVFLLLGLWALLRDRRELAAVLAVVAALTKIQLGILGLIVGFVVIRRSLWPREGQPDPARILSSVASGLGAAALICLPFTGLDFLGLAHRLVTPAGALTLAAGLVAAIGVYLAVRRGSFVEEATRPLVAAGAGVLTVVAFAAMSFESIASHIVNTFGEYPFLTLNAYNPWALVGDATGSAMDSSLSWLYDANIVDSDGTSHPGFNVGPFSGSSLNLILLAVLLLVAVAVVSWLWARMLDRDADEPGRSADSDAATASETAAPELATEPASAADASDPADSDASVKPPFRLPGELRALAAGCLVAAAAIVLILAGQSFGGLPAAIVGDAYLVAIMGGVALWAAWRDDRLSLLVAVAILAIAFFVVPTRVHERYLFPFFAVGAVLLALSWRWAAVYVVLAVVNSANLLAVLVEYKGIPGVQGADGTAGPISGGLGDLGNFFKTAQFPSGMDSPISPAGVIWPIALSAVVTGLVLVWALAQMRGRAGRVLAWEAAGAAEGWDFAGFGGVPDMPASGDVRWVSRSDSMAGDPESIGGAGAPVDPSGGGSGEVPPVGSGDGGEGGGGIGPVWSPSDADPEFVPGWVMTAWRWLSRRSVMPDRSASLNVEPHGRLDKMDLWLVAVLIVTILSMRIWRLDEPMQMHFDEVYHARTATEFLQEWRYGIPHDIYEWTHPHLAKYAIAGGLVAFSDDKVTSTGDLGVPVKDAVVQPRITPQTPDTTQTDDPRTNPDARLGDRLYVATGSAVEAYDLQTRERVWEYPIPGASTLSMAGDTGDMYVGTSEGRIWRIDTTSLDLVRLGTEKTPAVAVELPTQVGFAIAHLYAGSPPLILAVDSAGKIVTADGTGKIVGTGTVPGASDFAPMGNGPVTLVLKPPSAASPTPDHSAEAAAMATALGLDVAEVEAVMSSPSTGLEQPLDLGSISSDQVTKIQDLIDNGTLTDVDIDSSDPLVAVAYTDGLGIMDARLVNLTSTIPTDQPATSIAVNPNADQDSYVTAGNSLVLVKIDQTGTGTATLDPSQPLSKMPGAVTKVVYDPATKIAQVLGRTPDGSGWTVYAIETNGNAVFSDARLPWQPVAIGADVTPDLPNTDREALLAFAPDGSMASVDIGQFAFGWRIVGVLFGTLMAVCLYLLARVLFRRRSVGLLVALFSCIDGMFFVQSRIAMNDTYVGGFLLLAYLLFALLWLGEKTSRKAWLAFWFGMPALGVILGLALASKWVGLYAIASIGILILIRSALGRLITIVGLAAGTGILGWQAIAEMKTLPGTGNLPALLTLSGAALAVVALAIYLAATRARTRPDRVMFIVVGVLIAIPIQAVAMTFYPAADQNGSPNYTYFVIMFAATMIAAAANAYHPVAWSRQETWFAMIAPGVLGVLYAGYYLLLDSQGLVNIGATRLVLIAAAGIAAGPVIGAAFWVAGKAGYGPLAVPPRPDDPSAFAGPASPAPEGWLRLGSGFGLPAAWMAVWLVIVPVFVVYIALYIPWSMPWQPQTAETGPLPVLICWHTDVDGTCTDAFPVGHTGQTLMSLTVDMYNYHNDLRATHAASSPWWAWPMDLKPVWFESIAYGQDNTSMIYDGGNAVLWWLGIGAMAFACWQAFKRRSLGLTLIAVAFFWQWLSWSRIDRAAFQYHFYTALPFYLLALAYFLAELWHGASRRTWLLARVMLAGVIIFAPVLWLTKYQLCGLARVGLDDYWRQAVCGPTVGDMTVTTQMFFIAAILVIALAVLAIVLVRLERNPPDEDDQGRSWMIQLLTPVVIAGFLILLAGASAPRTKLLEVPVPSDFVALFMLIILGALAFGALAMRDSRRMVLAVCVAAVIFFVAFYPNLSALPMPASLAPVYNGMLPTWLYGFQFAVNQQESQSVALVGLNTGAVTFAVMCAAVLAGYAAWVHRVVLGYRRHLLVAGGPADGEGPAGGAEGSGEGGTPA